MTSAPQTYTPKIAIIGAGMAGVSAAHSLTPHCDVKLFDKSRGIGGRMSTRYAGTYEFDHGAQYFTIESAEFRAVIETAIDAGAAAPWAGRALYLKSGEMFQDTGRARYVGVPRMNSLPKFLAKDLDITLGRRISAVARLGDRWRLEFEGGEAEAGFDAVICTAPPAQTQHLLPASFRHMPAVTSAKMHACFALMIGLPETLKVSWETLRLDEAPVSWIAVNSAKPNRPSHITTLVIHADAAWSEMHQAAELGWVQAQLLEAAGPICGIDLKTAQHIALHRWLYASMASTPKLKTNSEQACLFDASLNLAACGDWCAGGRVEGAWRSGQAAGQRVLEAVKIIR